MFRIVLFVATESAELGCRWLGFPARWQTNFSDPSSASLSDFISQYKLRKQCSLASCAVSCHQPNVRIRTTLTVSWFLSILSCFESKLKENMPKSTVLLIFPSHCNSEIVNTRSNDYCSEKLVPIFVHISGKKKNPSWDLFKNSTATLGVYIGAAAFGNARAV